MRLFRRKQRPSFLSRALPLLDRWIVPVGTRVRAWAEPRLDRIERQLSRRQKMVLATVFCLIAGAYGTAALVEALTGHPSLPADSWTPTSISRPMPVPHKDSLPIQQHTPTISDSLSHQSPINK